MFIPEWGLWIIAIIVWIGITWIVAVLSDDGTSFNFTGFILTAGVFFSGIFLAIGIIVGKILG